MPGIIVPERLWELLHLDRAKAVMQSEQGYKGRRIPLIFEEFKRHLEGEVTLALSPLAGTRALFAVIDIDELFPALIPIVSQLVRRIGGEHLERALFLTNGSDEERGKVVIAFAEPVPSAYARRLLQVLSKRIRASEHAQHLKRDRITAFPQERGGGVVRILGRNGERNGRTEIPFSIYGEVGLEDVVPLPAKKLAEIVAQVGLGRPAWATRTLENPWVKRDGTAAHFDRMVALAREGIRQKGTIEGRELYDQWLDSIKINSPELSQPSLKNGDDRNVLDHGRNRAWEIAKRSPTTWKPLEFPSAKCRDRGAKRVYYALADFVRENGLLPHAFGIDYERVAVMLGTAKSVAYRYVQRAVEREYLVILDRGKRHSKGSGGKCTLIGLVGRDESAEQIHARGFDNERVRRRIAENAEVADHSHKTAEANDTRSSLREQRFLREGRFPQVSPLCPFHVGVPGATCLRCAASWSAHMCGTAS